MATPRKAKPVQQPSFDDAPLADDEDEGPCPIPDDDGDVVLRRSKNPTKGVVKHGKAKKPGRGQSAR